MMTTGFAARQEAGSSGIVHGVQEQLALKLESRRELIEVLVVDRVDRPTEN
jgi:uncharacterized protein (TIGR03435 family)